MLVLGTWIPALFPRYAVHGAHCFFIGGMSLMIIGVATRVTLAHGGHGLRLETRSWALKIVLIAFGAALITRLSAPWMPQQYITHLAYAAIIWIIGLTAWAIQFAPLILRRNLTAAAAHDDGREAPTHPAAKN